jgi:nucleotide-binding universal stress UspA family protein
MAQFKSILVPVDVAEPDTAGPAIERAADLAHASYGTIRLIYVRSILPVTYMEFVPPSFDAEQQRETEQKLTEIVVRIPLPAERVSAVVTMGSVYDDVLQEAEKSATDLIVAGSHRPSMATYLIGSNA